jgi:integrase
MQSRSSVQSQQHPSDDLLLFTWDNPGQVIDRNGRPVDTKVKVWCLQDPLDNIDLNWDTLETATDVKDAVRAHISHTIESQAPKTAHQVFKQLKYCIARLPSLKSAWDLTFEVMEGLLAELRGERKDWRFHYLRKWYQWCDDQGIPGFMGEVATQLYELRVSQNPKGERVMSRDVDEGPLSHDEHFLIRQAVKDGRGPLLSRVIIMLLLELGARPIQLVQLEEQDFIVITGPSGHKFYSLNVPRAKQRTVGDPGKKNRRISPQLGQLIETLIECNHSTYDDQGPQMPLLCVRNRSVKKLTKELRGHYELHLKVVGFAQRVRGYPQSANIISPRTGKLLKLVPRRLRYTYFTMLAEQGASTLHLAELADHSDDKSIAIYVASTSSVVERLNAALGKDAHFASIIKRFLGEVIKHTGNEDSAALIQGSTPTFKDLGGIGVCGANFLCNLYPPLSCYLCPKFQAWIDGPHEHLLLELEAYVERLIEHSGNPSDRIPHQLVDIMTAIRQLLKRIEEMKNGGANTSA